jgi:hypothetical protein
MISRQRTFQLACLAIISVVASLSQPDTVAAAVPLTCNSVCADDCPSNLELYCEQHGCTANGPSCQLQACDEPGEGPRHFEINCSPI